MLQKAVWWRASRGTWRVRRQSIHIAPCCSTSLLLLLLLTWVPAACLPLPALARMQSDKSRILTLVATQLSKDKSFSAAAGGGWVGPGSQGGVGNWGDGGPGGKSCMTKRRRPTCWGGGRSRGKGRGAAVVQAVCACWSTQTAHKTPLPASKGKRHQAHSALDTWHVRGHGPVP